MIRLAIVVCLILVAAIGCGSSYQTFDSPDETSTASKPAPRALERASGRPEDPVLPKETERMVISTATIRLKTPDPDSVQREVIALAYASGGYVVRTAEDFTSIRIPAADYPDALATVEGLGEVIERKLTGKDVTEQYIDLQTRLDNVVKTRDRYVRLLERATALNDILRLEKELEQLTQRIETLKSKMERLAHLEAYTTITVEIELLKPRGRLGPIAWAGKTLYKTVAWLF